jgi:hypothetical protein
MKTTTKTLESTASGWMKLVALVWLVLGAVACGDSEAVYALQDEPGAMMGEGPGKLGKGDNPGEPVVVGGGAPAADVALSTSLLEFRGVGYDAFIALESGQAVEEAFGEGAVVCSHNAKMTGLVLNWDGEQTRVFARTRRGGAVGAWQELELLVAGGGSFRARVMFEETHQVDVYIAKPSAVDFLMIEPLAPM